MNPALTICSVSYRHSKYLLENIELSKNLNPNTPLQWLIVNNDSVKDSLECVIKKYGDFSKVIDGPHNIFSGRGKGSKHHAAGLDLIVKHAKTRFILILDPDFYIVLPNWVNRSISHMVEKNFALFGVPWHPRWRSKYRYFPCIHCLFIDTAQISLSDLDFMPDFVQKESLISLRQILLKIPFLKRRAIVAQSKDTGYRIYLNFYNSRKVKYSVIAPSYSRKDLYNMYDRTNRVLVNLWIWLNLALDKLFPESMSVFPKKKQYYTKTTFADLGMPDCKQFGWEEFFFNKQPFGFHVRGIQQIIRSRQNDINHILTVLQFYKQHTPMQQKIRAPNGDR